MENMLNEKQYNCDKCVIKDWCDNQEMKPLVIGNKCMKYWERKTSTYKGIDFYNMDEEERKNHPVWKEMTPSERLSSLALASCPRHSWIKETQKIDEIIDLAKTNHPTLNDLDYFSGYEQGLRVVLRYLDNESTMEILDRLLYNYRKYGKNNVD